LTHCIIDPAVPIAGLSILRKLQLSTVSHFPADLWQLPDLRELHVDDTHTGGERLPANIPAHAKLEKLDLAGGVCDRLFRPLCALSNLTYLRTKDTVVALPDNISQLTSLRVLHLMEQLAMGCPPNLDRLTNLEELRLSMVENTNNAFSKPLPSVREMHVITMGNVESLDWSFLPGLTALTIALFANQTRLHPSIGCLTNLQALELSHCLCLGTLPAEIGRLTNLTALRLLDAINFTLPDAVSSLVRLRQLQAYGDLGNTFRLRQTVRLPASLTSLEISGTLIAPQAPLTALTRIRHLQIDLSSLAEESLPALRTMPSVRSLELCIDANYKRVTGMLKDASLRRLSVTWTGFFSMAAVIDVLPTLTNLRELHLTRAITPTSVHFPKGGVLYLPESITRLSRLACLNLISPSPSFPREVFLLTSLQELNVCLCEGADKDDTPTRLSPAVSNLVNLCAIKLPPGMMLCAAITSLRELTSVEHNHDGRDAEHHEAAKALRARGVRVEPQTPKNGGSIKRQRNDAACPINAYGFYS
jgi:hypothetical protein